MLHHLAFEGATKKTRPKLEVGDVVYARVSVSSKFQDHTELECVSATTGKADGLGPLKDGMVFDVSLGFAARLLQGSSSGGSKKESGKGVVLLGEFGGHENFEAAVGRNGRVWIKADQAKVVLKIGRALQRTDEQDLDEKQQKDIVSKLVKKA